MRLQQDHRSLARLGDRLPPGDRGIHRTYDRLVRPVSANRQRIDEPPPDYASTERFRKAVRMSRLAISMYSASVRARSSGAPAGSVCALPLDIPACSATMGLPASLASAMDCASEFGKKAR